MFLSTARPSTWLTCGCAAVCCSRSSAGCGTGGKDDEERISVMQVGIHFMNFTLPGGPAGLRAAVGDTAVAAEEAGCTVFTAMDHWFQMEHFADAHDPMLEGYSVLNFVAAKTETLRLGLLVTGGTHRHPG